MTRAVSRVRCLSQRGSLTDGALLVGEQDAAVASVCVGHADVVPICPVELPEGGKQI